MRCVIQRVSRASVSVDGPDGVAQIIGEIETGLLVLVGITHEDDEAKVIKMADKICGLRIMADSDGHGIERSVLDAAGSILVVSQFTLYGDTRKGRRPSWGAAARSEIAAPLVDLLTRELSRRGVPVATGRFGADMDVELVNDGPVTLVIEL